MTLATRVLKTAAALATVGSLLLLGGVLVNGTVSAFSAQPLAKGKKPFNQRFFEQGRKIFRFDTFGDQVRRLISCSKPG